MSIANPIKLLGIRLVSLLLLAPLLISAEEQTKTAPALRWFEIEVVLYKNTSNRGLSEESWSPDTQVILPKNLVNLLNPAAQQKGLKNSSDEQVVATEQAETFEPDLKKSSKIAFVKLSKKQLRLKSEARNISRHSRYNLLAHFAWRQPVLSKKRALNIRLAGGFDYHHSFNYSGEKKLNPLPIVENVPFDSKPPLVEAQSGQAVEENIGQQNLSEKKDSPAAIAEWVPEIDGSILIYIQRNYLHLDTNLYYRHPAKEAVNMFNLSNQLPSLPNSQSEKTLGRINLTQNESTTDNKNIFKGNARSNFEDNAFSWQYDGDFLSHQTEKVFTERLFNYSLKQNRRLKSKQLNYFDHPLIGMLVIITPYDGSLQSVENRLITDQNNGLSARSE